MKAEIVNTISLERAKIILADTISLFHILILLLLGNFYLPFNIMWLMPERDLKKR